MGAIKIEHLPQYKVEDYQRWEGDWELIRGIPYSMSPSANRLHQDIARNTLRMLMNALEADSCDCKLYYELDLILSKESVVRPDLMIFCEELSGDYPTVTPSLVVEILSESSRHIDEEVKFELYQENNIPYYIIIDPQKKTVRANELSKSKYTNCDLNTMIKFRNCKIKVDWDSIFGQ